MTTLRDTIKYCDGGDGSTTGYWAVPIWQATHAYAAAALVRPVAAAVGNERIFCCIVAGTSAGTEPSWPTTEAGSIVDSGATWIEVTGRPGVNGDIVNCPTRGSGTQSFSKGQIIYDAASGTLQLANNSGSATVNPSFVGTVAGQITSDGAVSWTCLGAASSFAAWAAPFARLQTAASLTFTHGGNDTTYLASEHTESQASAMTATLNGSATQPNNVLCVAKTPVPPTSVTTGAALATTGASNISITNAANANGYIEGVTITAGDGSSAANLGLNAQSNQYRNCTFKLGGTGAGQIFNASGNKFASRLENCNFQFAAVGQSIGGSNDLIIRGGGVIGSVFPTTLFQPLSAFLDIEGMDLSNIAGTLIGVGSGSNPRVLAFLRKCKLNAGVTMANLTDFAGDSEVVWDNCSSDTRNYLAGKINAQGTQTVEPNAVRSGGASNGTTSFSWKITPTTKSFFQLPFSSLLIDSKFKPAGTYTVTLFGIIDRATIPFNDEVWLELSYLGDSGSPLASFDRSTGKANLLATNAAQTADLSSSWSGSVVSGMSNPNMFKLSATITTTLDGFVSIRAKSASMAGVSVYIDPKPQVA